MATGTTIRLQVMGYTGITMERSTKENGLMITNMAREWKLGSMAANTMAIIMRGRKMEKGSIHGKTIATTPARGRTTRSTDLVLMFGVMEGSTKESG